MAHVEHSIEEEVVGGPEGRILFERLMDLLVDDADCDGDDLDLLKAQPLFGGEDHREAHRTHLMRAAIRSVIR